MCSFLSRSVLKLLAWHISGGVPDDLKKYILVVAPHTSYWDFFLGLLVRSAIRRRISYLGKKSLFRPPFGFLFRWTGGYPVDRSRSSNLVDQVADIFIAKEEFAIALAPEGTRSKVERLKTGFYHIARKAGIPVILVQLDYGNRIVAFSEPMYPGDDQEKDMQRIWDHFKGVRGKNPGLGIT